MIVTVSRLTSAKLFDDIGRPESTQVSAAESSQQTDTRAKAFRSWCYQTREFRSFTVQDDCNQRSSSLSQLVDDMYAICACR